MKINTSSVNYKDEIENSIFSLSSSFGCLPGATVCNNSDMIFHATNIKSEFFNSVVYFNSSNGNTEDKIDNILDFYKERNVSNILWWLTPKTKPENLSEYLLRKGFSLFQSHTGMAVDLSESINNIELVRLTEFKTKPVKTVKELELWCKTVSSGFNMPKYYTKAWSDALQLVGFSKSPWRLYIGWHKDKPVSTGMLFFDNHIASLFYICTILEERGKGFGTSIVNTLLCDAFKEKCEIGS